MSSFPCTGIVMDYCIMTPMHIRQVHDTYIQKGKERKMNGIKRLGYSKKQSVEATSLSLRSIDNLIATGKLKAMKAGTRVIISAESLENFIKKGTMTFRTSGQEGGLHA